MSKGKEGRVFKKLFYWSSNKYMVDRPEFFSGRPTGRPKIMVAASLIEEIEIK